MHLRGAGLVLLLLLPVAIAVPHADGAERPRVGWVVLPVEDYQALRAKAYPPERPPEPPPVASVVTRVDYDLKVAGESAVGEARLTVDVLREGWVQIGVPAGLLIREARVDGRPVSLVDPGAGKSTAPYVLISRPGRSTVVMDVAVPVTATGGSETLALPASAAAVSRAALSLQRQGVDLTLGGGFLADKAETPQATRYVAHGRPGEALVFSWRRKVEEPKVALPLRLRGSVVQLVSLGEDGAQISADVSVEVLQGVGRGRARRSPRRPGGERCGGTARRRVGREAGRAGSRLPGAGHVQGLLPSDRRSAPASRGCGGRAAVAPARGRPRDGGRGRRSARTGRDHRPATQGPRPRRCLRAGRTGGRARLAVAGGLPLPPQGWTCGAVAGREGRPLHAGGRAGGQRGGGALPGPGGGGRQGLVRARYAVRNNQRSFLALALPPQATLWSAAGFGTRHAAWTIGGGRAAAAAREGTRRRRSARLSRWRSSTSTERRAGPARAAPSSRCRRSTCRSRVRASFSTTRRASA